MTLKTGGTVIALMDFLISVTVASAYFSVILFSVGNGAKLYLNNYDDGS